MRRSATGLVWAGVAIPTLVVSAPYVDRVLEEGPQPALKLEQKMDTEGWARGWRVEASAAQDRTGNARSRSGGVAVNGFVETPQHGTFTLTAALSRSSVELAGARDRGTTTLWRLDQVGMPLDNGWSASHSVGRTTSVQVPMARGFGRMGLPTMPIEGLTGQYVNGPRTSYSLAAGRPGLYTGLDTTGFDTGSGRLLLAGGQQALAGALAGSTVAVQWNDAHDVRRNGNFGSSYDTQGLWGGWLWEGQAPWAVGLAPGPAPVFRRRGGLELQANVLRTRTTDATTGGPEQRGGAWVDARWRSDLMDQAGGLFYLDPDLRWGTYDLVSDLRGAYWRGDLSTRRWFLSASTEWAQSMSGQSFGGKYANLSANYRLDTRTALAGAVAVRRGDAPGDSVLAAVERQSSWGQTRWQAELLRAGERRTGRIGADHSITGATDGTVSLSLALEREEAPQRRSTNVLWGVVGSVQPWTGVTLDANLRGSRASDQRILNGGLGATWKLSPNWSVAAQWSHMRGQDSTPLAVLSPVNQAAELIAPRPFSSNRIEFTLRYQDSAGSSQVPIGGAPGAGSGTIVGYLYQDNNDNGRRDASERGVADVVVRLDGRFLARTDSQGRYEFALVAAGNHRIEVVPDNLPLPWNLPFEGAQGVDVQVRRTTVRDFGLRREFNSPKGGGTVSVD
jgi:hypothetical protein